jgi:tetraspanin-7
MVELDKTRFQTKACIAGLKTLLMLFNLVFWATGVILVILGIWMKASLGKYIKVAEQYSDLGVGVLFALTGVAIVVTSFLACNCTAKGQPRLLYIYAIILFVSFIIVLSGAIAGYVYRDNLHETFHHGLHDALDNYGQKNILDKDIDKLQQLLNCCGTNNYTDWYATSWAAGNETVPGSCCSSGGNCPPRTYVIEHVFTDGCYDRIVDFLSGRLKTIGGLGLICAFLQLFGGVLSLLLAKYINKAVYETLA